MKYIFVTRSSRCSRVACCCVCVVDSRVVASRFRTPPRGLFNLASESVGGELVGDVARVVLVVERRAHVMTEFGRFREMAFQFFVGLGAHLRANVEHSPLLDATAATGGFEKRERDGAHARAGVFEVIEHLERVVNAVLVTTNLDETLVHGARVADVILAFVRGVFARAGKGGKRGRVAPDG